MVLWTAVGEEKKKNCVTIVVVLVRGRYDCCDNTRGDTGRGGSSVEGSGGRKKEILCSLFTERHCVLFTKKDGRNMETMRWINYHRTIVILALTTPRKGLSCSKLEKNWKNGSRRSVGSRITLWGSNSLATTALLVWEISHVNIPCHTVPRKMVIGEEVLEESKNDKC